MSLITNLPTSDEEWEKLLQDLPEPQPVPEPPSCLNCKFRLTLITCVAFPDGIPWPIMSGQLDHRLEVPGDGGIRWEAAPGALILDTPIQTQPGE